MTKEDLLIGYFSNTLSNLHKSELENLLKIDAEFKAQFEFEKALKKVVKKKENDKLKAKLHSFEEELKTPSLNSKTEVTPKANSISWLKIAASLVLFVSAGWIAYNSFFSTNYMSLYDANFKAYPNTEVTIIRGDNTIDETVRKAFVAYESEDYNEAIKQFANLNADYVPFYKAQSYLKLGKLNKAKQFLNTSITNTVFVAESHWYLALIALKEKQKDQAVEQLQKVITLGTFKKDKAKELLEKL